MNSGRFWLRILNVYPNEWWMVKRLYLLQVFQGAGISLFFTSAFAQFLEKYPITELPWVMLLSAVFLWLTGFMYSKLEHLLSFRKFNLGVLFFMTASIFVFWIANRTADSRWFFYIMMAWFNVLYLLDNMGFWGVAALLFDLRQSKRIFTVLSAGDIPAKFIGYVLALVFVPFTGTRNLLLIGTGCILASLPILLSIINSDKLNINKEHTHKPKPVKHTPKQIGKLVSNILTNSYIRRIAFISLITTSCVLLLNYGFYGEVSKQYSNDVELATFIAFFYASVRIVAFIVNMIFASRLTVNLGVRSALFVTPLAMLLLTILIAVGGFTVNQRFVFYLFGAASILLDVLRNSFNSPVLLTLMQPLPTQERLRAHNIVKGIMDPFASFFSGVALLALLYLYKRVDLMTLCYILFILIALWIVGVVLVNRKYISILIKTIGSRYFSRDEFVLNDEAVMAQVKNKMMKGTEIEVISILTMLNSKTIDNVAEELITQLLKHPSDKVKVESVRVIGNRQFTNARKSLEALLHEDISENVKTEAVKTICRIGDSQWDVTKFVESDVENVRLAAIEGMLQNSKTEIRDKGEAAISELLFYAPENQKQKAVVVLCEVRDFFCYPLHRQLMNDSDPVIKELAIKAVGKAADVHVLNSLFDHIETNEKAVLDALYNAGSKTTAIIYNKLLNAKLTPYVQEHLINILGKTGDTDSLKVLTDLLKQKKHTSAIIKALHRSKYAVSAGNQKEFELIARTYISQGVELLYMQRALSKKSEEYDVLNNSLHHEIDNIRETLLSLFGCMYDRDKMNQVKYGLSAKGIDSTANAMEIIELTVKKDIGRLFNTMFEPTSIEQRCEDLSDLFTSGEFKEVEEILDRILSEKPIDYYSWTKAYSLYISKKYLHTVDSSAFEKFAVSDNRLLKETAIFAASKS